MAYLQKQLYLFFTLTIFVANLNQFNTLLHFVASAEEQIRHEVQVWEWFGFTLFLDAVY